MKTKSENISFRLDTELIRKLDRKREPFGDSRGQYARRMVVASLLHQHDEALLLHMTGLRQSLASLDDELHLQHDHVLTAVRRLAFLMLTAKTPLSIEQAKEFAQHLTLIQADR